MGTFDRYTDAIIAAIVHKSANSDMSNVLRIVNVDMWAPLGAKAEGEAEGKLESCNQGRDSGLIFAFTCGSPGPQIRAHLRAVG